MGWWRRVQRTLAHSRIVGAHGASALAAGHGGWARAPRSGGAGRGLRAAVRRRRCAAVRAPRPVPLSEPERSVMSRRHPIISITGSSGAGTTSVKRTFETIFRRENVKAVYIEGDAFHRYDREEMRRKMAD